MKRLVAVSLLSLLFGCGQDKSPRETASPLPAEKCVPAAHRLCPVDEAVDDSSFFSFRRQMMQVVDRKDAQALMNMIDPAIRTSFGDDGGAKAFSEMWQPQSPSSSLWKELQEILANGGSFREIQGKRTFWAPYVFSTWPDTIDAFQHTASIRANAPLRTSPADSVGVLATLDWTIVELVLDSSPPPDSAWVHVRAPDGSEGWVLESDLRGPMDYRAGFDRTSGSWKMSVLVAGD